MASGVLKVELLSEGVHSGDASGLVPSSFRIMRQVLDRLVIERSLSINTAAAGGNASLMTLA